MRQNTTFAVFILLLLSARFLLAQPGTLDLTFNPSTGSNSLVLSTAIQNDGKILIGGLFTSYNGIGKNYIARVNSDGSIDDGFNLDGSGINGGVSDIVILSTGKILVSGSFSLYNGISVNNIICLNSDGSLDNSFNTGIGFDHFVDCIAVQADNKILVGGYFTSVDGIQRNHVARLNSDGSLDQTFNPGSGANDYVYELAVQDDGKILISGHFTYYNGVFTNHLVRVNEDGSIDSGFNMGAGLDGDAYAILIQTDNKILAIGHFNNYNGTYHPCALRINSDGTIDTGYDTGVGANNYIVNAALQTNGKVVMVGAFTQFNGVTSTRIVRLNTDGTIDNSFDSGTGLDSVGRVVTIQPNGKIIIGGDFTSFDGSDKQRIARINDDGSLDEDFNPQRGTNNLVATTSIQSDGKIIIGGAFTTYNGSWRSGITRVNIDGSLDQSFNVNGLGSLGEIWTTAIQNDGKILIGGRVTVYNGVSRNRIARLNDDGTLDLSFGPGAGLDDEVNHIVIQPDGKIIVVGNFNACDGVQRNKIARLNTDGSLDMTFDPGSGANGAINIAALQSDGKILIGGAFVTYNGTSINRIARLNIDGSLDESFNVGVGAINEVRTVSIQNDGKIILGGFFGLFNGTFAGQVVRLNSNGSIDFTFNSGTGANSFVLCSEIQNDGKILLGGGFTYYGTIPVNRLVRLNSDGTFDATFNVGQGPDNYIQSISFQNDDKLIIGGLFTTYDGVQKKYLARVKNNIIRTQLTGSLNICAPGNYSIDYTVTGDYNSGNIFYAQLSDANGSFANPVNIGALASTTSGVINIALPDTLTTGYGYRIRVAASDPLVFGKDNGADIIINQTPKTEVCLVSVDSASTHNIVIWDKPVTSLIDRFNIYRETTTNNYQQITTVLYDSLNEFHDFDSDPNSTTYKYKVSTTDQCGFESAKSDYHNTIHLQNLGGGNLQWTQYGIENSGTPVIYYRIYRDDFGTNNFQPINSAIPGGNTTYTDANFSSYPDARYVVDVNWNIACTPFRDTESTTRSNVLSLNPDGVEEWNANKVSVYPNPANETVTVEFSAISTITELEITNMLGEIVYSESLSGKAISEKQIDVSTLADGVYTLRIKSYPSQIFRKIIRN